MRIVQIDVGTRGFHGNQYALGVPALEIDRCCRCLWRLQPWQVSVLFRSVAVLVVQQLVVIIPVSGSLFKAICSSDVVPIVVLHIPDELLLHLFETRRAC